MTHTGECRYCGQIHVVEGPEELSRKEIDELATWQCVCKGAINYKERETCKAAAVENIRGLFNKNYGELQELLIAAVPMIADGVIKKVTVDTGGRVKATLTGKGAGIKVEKSIKEVQSLES